MNPPPIPPSATQKTPFPRQAATACLMAPVLVILLSVANAALLHGENSGTTRIVLDVAAAALISLGMLLGILALVGIPQYGTKGILGKSIAGLIINGLLTIIFAANLFVGYQKKLQARTAALDKVKSVEAEIREGDQKDFDPKTGFTNSNPEKLDRLSSALKSASTNLSGDEASVSQAMAAHVARLHSALTNYQAAALELRKAEVLNHFSTTDKGQFVARRQVVDRFLKANGALTDVITNSESRVLADLTKARVTGPHIKSTMENFHATAAPLNAVTVRIRACDDRVGASILEALNLLETSWYKWTVDSKTGSLRFEDGKDLDAYNKALQDMDTAGQDQIKLQQQLARLQQNLPTQ